MFVGFDISNKFLKFICFVQLNIYIGNSMCLAKIFCFIFRLSLVFLLSFKVELIK